MKVGGANHPQKEATTKMVPVDDRCSFLPQNTSSDRINTDFAHQRESVSKIGATDSEYASK